jgi:hypothetical protein
MLGQTLPVPPGGPSITIRRAKQEDAPECGRICFDAFYGISTKHGFPPDFPSPDVAVGLLSMMFSHPGLLKMPSQKWRLHSQCSLALRKRVMRFARS